jgi:hypothetical protein
MEFILFVIIVVFWRVWLYPILSLVNFLPSSFFVSDSTGGIGDAPAPRPVRKPYFDSTPDPFINLDDSHVWRADQFMSGEAKTAYLQSIQWAMKRSAVLIRDNFQCQACGSKYNLEVHHISYINLGNESLEDLITLCNFHHQAIHDILGYDRTTTFDISILPQP